MNRGVQSGSFGVLFVVFNEESTCFLVQRTFWEWHNKQTADHVEDVGKSPVLRIPVLLQRVDADFAVRRHVRVENFSEEVALRWLSGKLSVYVQRAAEHASFVRGANYGERCVRSTKPYLGLGCQP